MRRNLIRPLLCIFLALAGFAVGGMVGPALPLDKLTAEADFIFKGEALGSEPVQDEWFKPVGGFAPRETRFKIISAIKGEPEGAEIRFRHRDKEEVKHGFGMGSMPQFYHFEPGRSYIVFAKKTATEMRQTRLTATARADLGVLRCLDNRPTAAKTVPEIFWAELAALRESARPADVRYALEQYDAMSEKPERFRSTADFPRRDVLAVVQPFIFRPEPEIAQAAIRILGTGSPYLSDEQAPYWLGTVGVPLTGLAQMDPAVRNIGGATAWRDLARVAGNRDTAPETRALAIRAMGLVKAEDLGPLVPPWFQASEAPVRAAAVLLYADFAAMEPSSAEVLARRAEDASPTVRKCAAYAIGFVQQPAGVIVLGTLLEDDDAAVRRAAMESLLAFSPKVPMVAAAMQAQLGKPESHPLFLLALAREDPGAHLEALARVVEEKPTPTNSSGGEIPDFTAWKLLFKHLRAQPAAELRAGKWDRYLGALEKVGQYSSSEPRDVYAFYLQRGMPERAAKYREQVKKTVTYDLDYYFKMVDKDPAAYEGN